MKNFFQTTIINGVDFSGYDGIGEDLSTKERLKHIIKLELNAVLNVRNLEQYVRGLPSVLTFPYMNGDIISDLENVLGHEIEEQYQDGMIDAYWHNLAKNLWLFLDGDKPFNTY